MHAPSCWAPRLSQAGAGNKKPSSSGASERPEAASTPRPFRFQSPLAGSRKGLSSTRLAFAHLKLLSRQLLVGLLLWLRSLLFMQAPQFRCFSTSGHPPIQVRLYPNRRRVETRWPPEIDEMGRYRPGRRRVQDMPHDVIDIVGNTAAFAALLADGSVFTWGSEPRRSSAGRGGDSENEHLLCCTPARREGDLLGRPGS